MLKQDCPDTKGQQGGEGNSWSQKSTFCTFSMVGESTACPLKPTPSEVRWQSDWRCGTRRENSMWVMLLVCRHVQSASVFQDFLQTYLSWRLTFLDTDGHKEDTNTCQPPLLPHPQFLPKLLEFQQPKAAIIKWWGHLYYTHMGFYFVSLFPWRLQYNGYIYIKCFYYIK